MQNIHTLSFSFFSSIFGGFIPHQKIFYSANFQAVSYSIAVFVVSFKADASSPGACVGAVVLLDPAAVSTTIPPSFSFPSYALAAILPAEALPFTFTSYLIFEMI